MSRRACGAADQFAHTGKQSVRIASNRVANSFHGIGQAVAVKGGQTYRFTVQVRNDPAGKLQGSVRGRISIEWQDASGKEIDRTWGPDFDQGLSAMSSRRGYRVRSTADCRPRPRWISMRTWLALSA